MTDISYTPSELVFTYYQTKPSHRWVIDHFLDAFPVVEVRDSRGNEANVSMAYHIQYVDKQTLVVWTETPLAGIAYLRL
jgi:hypothetical protein